MKKLKEKKGFTLVELIVVLVILAILAALLIPALTGYIDKAKRKSIVAETRQVVMAAQTLADEAYGKIDLTTTESASFSITFGADGDVTLSDVEDLAEVSTDSVISVTCDSGAKISEVVYKGSNGKYCQYKATLSKNDNFTDGHYNVTDVEPSSN